MQQVRKYIRSWLPYLCIAVFLFASFTIVPKSDEIVWSPNIQLTWDDFQCPPINSSAYSAESSVGIEFSYNPAGDTLIINVKSVFHKKKSWVKKNEKTSTLLIHEQGHFYIVEIFARKLRKELSEQKYKKKNYKVYLDKIIVQYNDLLKKEHTLYDSETNFSQNQDKQKEWLEKIKNELTELDAYSSPIIKNPLKR